MVLCLPEGTIFYLPVFNEFGVFDRQTLRKYYIYRILTPLNIKMLNHA